MSNSPWGTPDGSATTGDTPGQPSGPALEQAADDLLGGQRIDTRHRAQDPGHTPLLFDAEALQLRGREQMVFGPLDWKLDPAYTGVVSGRQGSGRSALLLALAGRLKGATGRLQVGEVDGIGQPRALRKRVSVARIVGLAELEPNLTVGESRDERSLAEGISTKQGREAFAHLEEVLGHSFDVETWTERLPALERTLLTVMLGCLRPADYVVVDDLDADLTDSEIVWMHRAMALLRADGHHFVISMLEQSPLPAGSSVLHLTAPPRPGEDAVLPPLNPLPHPGQARQMNPEAR